MVNDHKSEVNNVTKSTIKWGLLLKKLPHCKEPGMEEKKN
jgi:hypothetical protein